MLHDGRRGITRTGKRLTTRAAPGRAIVDGILRLLAETGIAPGEVAGIVHGTTPITNTVLERTGARVGRLATSGFRDVAEMGRESRYGTDDLFLAPPPAAVHDRYGVSPALRIAGPAVVQDRESSRTFGPDAIATVDDQLNRVIEIAVAPDATAATGGVERVAG